MTTRRIILAVLLSLALHVYSGSVPDYIVAINEGRLTEAKELIENLIVSRASNNLDMAVAYKHLGTVNFRLGKEFDVAFAASEKLFKAELSQKNDIKTLQQYSLMLFQRANCLISACEAELSKSKLQGISPVPFKFVKSYIAPAEKDLNAAKTHYPKELNGDIELLSLELAVAEYHIWKTAGQESTAQRAAQKALDCAKGLSTAKGLPADTQAKFAIRYATLMVEMKNGVKEAIGILEESVQKSSGNVELDAATVTLWARLQIKDQAFDGKAASLIEKRLIMATDKLEELRAQNVEAMDFVARKEYFSSRTGLYELLVELYAKMKQPFKMLNAIDRMRSRAIQDFVNKEANLTEKELCATLKENAGMMVAYFIATDTVWIITFDGNGGSIAHTERNGQEIAQLSSGVISVFSNPQHPMTYLRYGPAYRIVPESYHVANQLYKELLSSAHKKFIDGKYEHFYVLLHNVLNYLPLQSLVIKINENNALLSQYVADMALPLTYLPSLSAIRASSVKYDTDSSMVLARGTYSYPAFYNNCPENPDNPNAQPLNLPNVPQEGEQVKKILGTAPDLYFVEKGASEFNLMKYASEKPKSIVHIASHAHLNRKSPLDSYVVLAASDNEDGKVKVRELLGRYKGTLKVGLLVLSACDTNKGEASIQPGDDIAALSNAFLVAGVENVIATQWPASDTSFPQIMEMFYGQIKKGTSPDVALAKAQQQFLMGGQMALRYPIFWANIVLCGKNQKKE